MKRLVIYFVILAVSVAYFDATAQEMDKKEKKEWKKRVKKLEPEEYKGLIEENRSLKSQVSSLRNELNGVDAKISEKDDQIAQYSGQISDLRNQLAQAQARAQQAASAPRPQPKDDGGIDESVGVVFKVQIGAFTNKDLSKYTENSKTFSQEEGDGVKRFTLGVFRDYWEADTFKKYLREMGVKDAWIVSYKDGVRVPIKDVLEGITNNS
ncbi:MAG: SPOR domain-containing protein [Bacteroidota bacterium]